MNTKSSEISSGLVVVAVMNKRNGFICKLGDQTHEYQELLVRLSDAEAKLAECVTSYEKEVAGLTAELDVKEAIIAQKDAEIIEQCRINGMGAERELHLLAQVAAKDAEIERLKHKPTIEDADTAVDHLRAYAADNGYSHGDYADVMSAAASQIEQQAERIKELEDLIESVRSNNEALHFGRDAVRAECNKQAEKLEKQSTALKLARQVLMSVKETSSSTRLRRIVNEPLAAINEVLGE